jgi:hypothetical protein
LWRSGGGGRKEQTAIRSSSNHNLAGRGKNIHSSLMFAGWIPIVRELTPRNWSKIQEYIKKTLPTTQNMTK